MLDGISVHRNRTRSTTTTTTTNSQHYIAYTIAAVEDNIHSHSQREVKTGVAALTANIGMI